jgi:hypothetical protein
VAETPEGEDEESTDEDDFLLTVRRLQGLQQGIAALLMPVESGWRVHYFSRPTFDTEPGTDFPDFDAALAAIAEVLPVVNTSEEKARAQEELRQYLEHVTRHRTIDDHDA